MSRVRISTTVNGEPVEFLGGGGQSLLDALRDELRLTGSKEGCGTGDCGACSVPLDGRLVCSCLVLGAEAEIAQGDVSDDEDCRRIAAVAARFGRLDALVNNAGITKHVQNHADLDGLTKEDFIRLYAVNTIGPFQMLRACRALLEAAERPSVLMTSSISAVTGIGSSVAYAASKGALNTMTLSLARALAPKIRVNAICPGFIDTRWFSDVFGEEKAAQVRERVAKSVPLQVASKPEDIADAALFLISDAARHVTGETLMIDGGMHLGFAPTRAR